MDAQCPPVVVLEEKEGRGPEEPPRYYEDDAEAAGRSRRTMERCTRGAEVVAKVLLVRVAILLSPHRREKSRQNTLVRTRTTRSGARSFHVDSVACDVADHAVDGVAVEEDDPEAAARSRCTMERCTRGARVVAKVLLVGVTILLPPLTREGSWRNTLAWTRTTRSGARSLLVDSVACAVAVRVVDMSGG